MMSMSYGYGTLDDKESRATLDRAIELGVNLLDAADVSWFVRNVVNLVYGLQLYEISC
ncbi:hypothetical protein ACRQ5D_21875 [Mucilaginibacter sp. P25]|uniref:hypothetical protein n=1 Tax=Mucilaginibacter TaxID=423349 RepID=UPI002109E6CF|nr:hypothetical protein [Mucilaginibacter gossypii]